MRQLSLIDPATAPARTAGLLAEARRRLGVTPNMTKAMANSAALLKGYLDLSGALAHGVLDVATRELIALTVAQGNECDYCLSAHSHLAEHVVEAAWTAGVTDEEIAETIGHVALNVPTNYFNKTARVEIDFPVVTA
jgi:AhpD family alkylhydroperoxidase